MNSRIWFAGLALSAGLCSFSFGQVTGTASIDSSYATGPVTVSGLSVSFGHTDDQRGVPGSSYMVIHGS